jgi:uncharacterized protein (UPF0332 family)
MSQWLLNRLFEAKVQANPQFAFQGTVNWMRALAEIVNSGSTSDAELNRVYGGVSRRAVNTTSDTSVFENIFMAHHNLASLSSINTDIEYPYDTCRSAIVSWYYTTYFSASAMIAASSGSTQETHAATAKVWQADIIENDLIPYPFNLYLSSLVTTTMEGEIETYRDGNPYDLNDYADSDEIAHGAIVSYLKGTHGYKKWESEERIKNSREFKALGVANFRKNVARELRDNVLERGYVNYLVQAFRFRGKANYRDSIFLSYGPDKEEIISQFTTDLLDVSNAFIRSAALYASKRVERGSWDEFIDDIDENTRLSITTDAIKI